MEVRPEDLKAADYNPRKMSKSAKDGLKKSIEEFSDISGITYNKKTGNIVAGHHRWQNLIEIHGQENLKFKRVKGTDRMMIFAGSEFTGFTLRVVEWSVTREKAANITANSNSISGEFTEGLQDILKEVQLDFDEDLFSELKLDDMLIDIGPSPERSNKKSPKSKTVMSAGGEKYKLLKLEVSPELADRFDEQLSRFKFDSDSVEKPLDTILSFIEKYSDDDVLGRVKAQKKATKRVRSR